MKKTFAYASFAALLVTACTRTIEVEIPPVLGEPSATVLKASMNVNNKRYFAEIDIHVVDDRGEFIRILGKNNFSFKENRYCTFGLNEFRSGSTGSKGDYSAMLLLDQSGSITSSDRDDSRIEASKIFLNSIGSGDEVGLASFTSNLSNDFTVHHNFSRDIAPMLNTLDILAKSEGGGTPLYYSTFQMIDEVKNHAHNGKNKALIVFTDGGDTDGGATPQQIIAKAVGADVQLFTVGLGGGLPNLDVLSNMAHATGGYFMWAQDARQLISYFGTLGNLLQGNAGFYRLRWEVFPEKNFSPGNGTYLFEFVIKLSNTKTIRTVIPLTFPSLK